MKISAGFEPYHQDSSSFVKTSHEKWWLGLDPRIRQEKTSVQHSSLMFFILGKLFSAFDWLLRALGIAGPHYFKVKKKRDAILAERDQWAFYKNLAEQRDANLVFVKPKSPDLETVESKLKEKLKDGEILRIKFPSTFEPLNEFFKDNYWQRHAHQNVPMEFWRHEGGPRPTIIALHGYNGATYAANRFIFAVKDLYAEGYNVCLIKQPFHRGKPRSQADVINIFGHGPNYTNEVMANAVYDVRACMSYLLDNGHASKIALTGASFGGFVGALVTSVEERLQASILLEPLVNLPDSLLEWYPLKPLFEQIKQEENISEEEFKQLYACSVALTYQSAIEKDRLLLMSGVYDIIAMPRYVKLLGEHWGQCKLIWKDASHLGHTSLKPYVNETVAHLRSVDFV